MDRVKTSVLSEYYHLINGLSGHGIHGEDPPERFRERTRNRDERGACGGAD